MPLRPSFFKNQQQCGQQQQPQNSANSPKLGGSGVNNQAPPAGIPPPPPPYKPSQQQQRPVPLPALPPAAQQPAQGGAHASFFQSRGEYTKMFSRLASSFSLFRSIFSNLPWLIRLRRRARSIFQFAFITPNPHHTNVCASLFSSLNSKTFLLLRVHEC